ncbi:DUF5343 domain-containing protein [Dokdonella fugitiva]|jgi:hypothetical protein|uniref:DUF5343 domain-containing protein n=1 Tax=Dokdonella fugitiva TaxID=328517 RepID=UPI0015FDE024|nr:DUF5343 domain-containing protein [Dokdonella fugitiva]MBA8884417.1 hypothetical protein [Dokdonella fugitiva]
MKNNHQKVYEHETSQNVAGCQKPVNTDRESNRLAGACVNDKAIKPPYTSYKSFETLIGELRSHEVLPAVIDRSLGLLRKRSGSEQAALIAALKWFKLIGNEGERTKSLDEYLAADEAKAKGMLKAMIEQSYSAVTDGTFNLKSATTQQMTDKFREYEISGSTLSKCISFFLAATRDAGIQVSPHVKAPTVSPAARRKAKVTITPPAAPQLETANSTLKHHAKPDDDSMISIPIPIAGKDGAIILPRGMTDRQWNSVVKMIEFIINNYRETMADEAGAADAAEEPS